MVDLQKLALQASCEKLLAVAASSVLPTLIPLEGKATPASFEYDFLFQGSFDKSLLLLITERFRRLIQEDIPFETLSMVPANAQAFLQKKQPEQAKNCANFPANIVPLCKVKNFYDISPDPLLGTSRDIKDFVLYELIALPDSRVRIRGAAFPDKKSLRNFVKQVERAIENDPVHLGDELDLLSLLDADVLWHPKGMVIRDLLQELWRKTHKASERLCCIDTWRAAEAMCDLYQQQKKPFPYHFSQTVVRENLQIDGLFQTSQETSDILQIFCNQNELQKELISSLQFIKQMASILLLDCHFVLLQRGKETLPSLKQALSTLEVAFETERQDRAGISVQTYDLRGRAWPIATVSLVEDANSAIECVILSYERIVALLLERTGGLLPFWLAPVQVRVVPLEPESRGATDELMELLQKAGIRADEDARQSSLNEKMYEARHCCVPCVVVIGKQERKENKLSVRFLQDSAACLMDRATFFEKLKIEGKTNT